MKLIGIHFGRMLESEALPGIILIIAGSLAMLLSNSPFSSYYFDIIHKKHLIDLGFTSFETSAIFWVNEALMSIFFLDIGIEIKEQVVAGHLSTFRKARLPFCAALGGVLVPAGLYLMFNYTNPAAAHGWAIPCATDIAFALGILMLLGHRIPNALKVLLLAIAVIDDLIAIIIIAFFYTHEISYVSLFFASLSVLVLILMNHFHVKNVTPYLMVGTVLWYFTHSSGIHATLTGVVLAFAIPLEGGRKIDNILYYWVSFVILPLFALANAGVNLSEIRLIQMIEPVPFAIAIGLIFGKPMGIFSFAYWTVESKLSVLPDGVTWQHIMGMSILCGLGFTMSIFIGNLAFEGTNTSYEITNKIGILIGSSVSAIVGYLYLRFNLPSDTSAKRSFS